MTLQDCQEIIDEFDTRSAGALHFDDFINLFEPSSMQDDCHADRHAHPPEVSMQEAAVMILALEREMRCRLRNTRMYLWCYSINELYEVFLLISNKKDKIYNFDLETYLCHNEFHPTT